VKHRIDQTVDTGRYHADYLDRDEFGPFVWAYYIALQTHDAVTFSADAHSVVVDLAYVIDPSLGYDTTFDSNKVDWVATATVDGANAEVSAEPEVIPEPEPQPESASSAPLRRAEPVLPAPIEQLAEEGPSVSREQFGHALDGALATLGTLTGSFPLDMPRPREVKARKHSPDRFRGGARPTQANEVAITLWIRDEGCMESTADPRGAVLDGRRSVRRLDVGAAHA
jgi:hypothetical protein